MANGVNGDNIFANFSTKLNNLYKDKEVELSQSDMKNIFNAAIKEDKDGVLDVNEFIKAAESYDSEKFGNVSFLEKTAEFEEFADAFDDFGMLDGIDGLSSDDISKMTASGEKKFPESVFKENPKLKTEDNKNYVEVEDWNSRKPDNNDCLEKIIKNNYDLNALGIKPGSKEYVAIEKAVMDANEQIYGTEDKQGRTRMHDGQRHSSVLYTGDKVVLPDLYDIKELQELGLKRPEPEKTPEPEQPVNTPEENPDGKLVSEKDGKKVYVKGATVTTYEKTADGEIKTIVNHEQNGIETTTTEQYDKSGRKTSSERITEDKEHDNKSVVSETYDEKGRVIDSVVQNTDLNNKIKSGYTENYKYDDYKGNTSDPTETVEFTHTNLMTGEKTTETTTKFLARNEERKDVTVKSEDSVVESHYKNGKLTGSIETTTTENGKIVNESDGNGNILNTYTIDEENSEDHRPDPPGY